MDLYVLDDFPIYTKKASVGAKSIRRFSKQKSDWVWRKEREREKERRRSLF